jgi:hypothetical protein
LEEVVPANVKWKQRWDEVQRSLKDQEAVAAQAGLYQPAINWFPGHMYKASKEMEEMLSQKDISLVLEIRDSRVCVQNALFFLS